ncbi:MAG TPA: BTAD domain-containing putative transcriptional regulator [Burkholderiaceae bacterium]|nr:BTAD domain-containing putative transcriptional regulator [Burkholderiaceae bacterium]
MSDRSVATRRLSLLGRFRLDDEHGNELAINSRKARALLALVALSGSGGVERGRAAALLWGESSDERARHNLRQTLSELQRAIAVPLAAGERLVWPADQVALDAREFESLVRSDRLDELERADSLYVAELLPGFGIGESGFDDWLEAERRRLAQLYRTLLERMQRLHSAAGDHAAAMRVAERRIEVDPGDEAAWRELIRACDAAGRRDLALRNFQRCCDALARHLDAVPSPQTVALIESIRRNVAAVPDSESDAAGDPVGGATARAADARIAAGMAAHASRHPLIAVLELDGVADDPPLQALAASLTQALVAQLDRVAGFGVAAGSFLFAGIDPRSAIGRQIVHEHRVAYLVTGRLQRERGRQLRLTMQLFGADGHHCWSRHAELASGWSARQRDELIASIVGGLERQLALDPMHRRTDHLVDDGWQKVRDAMRALFARGWSEEAVDHAVRCFRDAIDADPALALAHAQKGLVLAFGSKLGLVRGERLLEEARIAADRAIAIAPSDSEVLGYAGCAIADLGEPRLASPLLERAVEENPHNPQAWGALGACELSLARPDEAIEHLQRSVRLGASDYRRCVWQTLLSRALLHRRRNGEAIEAARIGVRSDIHFYPAWLALAAAQYWSGQRSEAARSLACAKAVRPRLRIEETYPWIGPRLALRLGEIWSAAASERVGPR